AVAENAAVFHGWEAGGITGIAQASTNEAIALGEDCERYPRHVSKAVDALRGVGIDGPYGMALGPEAHTNVLETSQHGGYPLLAATLVALVWANADASSYNGVWNTDLSIQIGDSGISQDLGHWVNSGLMAFFFFVIGLEARREFDLGELRDREMVSLPALAGL